MALAHAGRKSRPSASRSTSTTASSAKAAKKTAEKSGDDIDDWTAREQRDANEESWGVYPVIDMATRRLFVEIFYTGTRFKTDNKAREHVAARAKAGDALALRAIRAVFRSKVDPRGRKK